MSRVFVLDACALLALLKNEDGADTVAAVYREVENGDAELIINRVNLFEVYYGFYRDQGKEYAERIMAGVEQSIISISEFDKAVFSQAGRLKASYKISLADAIALAQAIETGGKLLTADHHEMDVVEQNEKIAFAWIR